MTQLGARPLGALLLSLVWCDTAMACAVCGGGGLNRQAYINTTVGLTLFALFALGGTAFWLLRTYVRADEVAAAEAREQGRRRG